MQLVIPPPIEDVLVGYLQHQPLLGSIPVDSKIPITRPRRFVRLWRSGGQITNLVLDNPVVTLEAYADTEPAAERLGTHVAALVAALEGTTLADSEYADRRYPVHYVRHGGGPSNLPNPAVPDRFRYQLTYQLGVRCAVIETQPNL